MARPRKHFGTLPTDQVQMSLSDIADALLPGRPVSLKDEFVRAIEWEISNWLHTHGGPPQQMATHWGPTDARIRVAVLNEGCADVWELAKKSDKDLLRLPNFGRGSLQRLREITTGERQPLNIYRPRGALLLVKDTDDADCA